MADLDASIEHPFGRAKRHGPPTEHGQAGRRDWAIAETQQRYGGSLYHFRQASSEWRTLLGEVRSTVCVMPLWKLQTIGEEKLAFLYDNLGGGKSITLKPGVAYCLRAFYGLLQDLIQGAWIRFVQKLNCVRLGNLTDLGTFLFGQERNALDAYPGERASISGFGNFLDAEAPNLLVSDPDTLGPILLAFKTQTYDFEIGNTNVLGGKHIVTYGGNVRQNNFDISLAEGDNRTEFGAYAQWEYFVDKFRIAVGGRVDKFGNLDDPVFSPRVSLMFKPTPDHSIRASYNRAFVSPSFINNYLNQNIEFPQVIDLTPLKPLLGPAGPSSRRRSSQP